MLDVEEKNVALSDKKKNVCIQKCFRSRKSEGQYLSVYKELITWRWNEILPVYHNVQTLINLFASEDWKGYYFPSSINTCGETSNLSTVTALQVNVILHKNIYRKHKKTWLL
jgi:hypothetical protein